MERLSNNPKHSSMFSTYFKKIVQCSQVVWISLKLRSLKPSLFASFRLCMKEWNFTTFLCLSQNWLILHQLWYTNILIDFCGTRFCRIYHCRKRSFRWYISEFLLDSRFNKIELRTNLCITIHYNLAISKLFPQMFYGFHLHPH